MGKDSARGSWDERLKEKGKVLCKTLRAMKPNVFSFLHSLQWWVTFSFVFCFFLKLFCILKSALISTRNPWDILNAVQWERAVTVEGTDPARACGGRQRRPLPHSWRPRALREVTSLQGRSVFPQLNAVVCRQAAAREPSALHVEEFSEGNFGCNIELMSVVPSLKKQTNRNRTSERRGSCYS